MKIFIILGWTSDVSANGNNSRVDSQDAGNLGLLQEVGGTSDFFFFI